MANLKLSHEQKEALLSILKQRFEKNMHRHKELEWSKIQAKLEGNPAKLWSLDQMEETEGEPDVIGYDTDYRRIHLLRLQQRKSQRSTKRLLRPRSAGS